MEGQKLFKIVCYIPAELEIHEDEVFESEEAARSEIGHFEVMHPENMYRTEELTEEEYEHYYHIQKKKEEAQASAQLTLESGMNLLTTSEIADFLRLSPQHITRLCRKGEMPHFRLGPKAYRFDKNLVLQWIKQSDGKIVP